MNIKMITIHNLHNFGSVFQAMALNQYLLRQGHECQVIDYNPPYFTKGSLKSRLGKLLNFRAYRRRKAGYQNFVEKNMKLTAKSYTNLEQLRREHWDAEVFVAGGDQLWNEFYDCGKDDAYKLSFTDKPKFAFGTSLGKSHFTQLGMAHLKQEVAAYTAIGVREQSGARLLQEAGIPQAHCVCDPVFLLNQTDYRRFVRPVAVKDLYVFVYLVEKSSLLDTAVQFVSEKLGLKVVLYAGFVPKCRCDVWIRDQGPEETLSYIVNARFVLSASFHATAFSVLFHKEFLTLLPGENTNARIEDFLELIDLKERMVFKPEQLEGGFAKKIDWTRVDESMQCHIAQSKDFLHSALEKLS